MIGARGEESGYRGLRVLAFLALWPAAFVAAEERGEVLRNEPAIGRPRGQPGLPPQVRVAIRHAQAALEDPRCREIFRDFRDASGNTLQDRLDSLGLTGQAYLEGMLFYDGERREGCRASWTLATMTPGHRVVFYCRSAFERQARRDPWSLAVAILHEELHSLGLGEDPPTSLEISRQVEKRCR
jgi:hypothetical protein